ncbi:MAG: hypothetical protein AB7O97_24305 [Planctomycetota bacterium]
MNRAPSICLRCRPIAVALALAGAAGLPAQDPAPGPKQNPQQAPTQAPGTGSTALKFGWPVPGRAIVTWTEEHRRDDGGPFAEPPMKQRCDLLVATDGERDVVRVTFGDVEILELAGNDATTPLMKRQIGILAARQQVGLPAMRIGSDGRFKALESWDTFGPRLDASLQRLVAAGSMVQQATTSVRQMIDHPPHRERTLRRLSEVWDAWVGVWAGRELQPRQRLELDTTEMVEGVEVPVHVRFEHRGGASGDDGQVRLARTATSEGDALARAVLGADADGAVVRRREQTEVTADPTTLVPSRVAHSVRVDIERGGRTVTRADTWSFEFQWTR